jgi:serine/threonine-protein kinase
MADDQPLPPPPPLLDFLRTANPELRSAVLDCFGPGHKVALESALQAEATLETWLPSTDDTPPPFTPPAGAARLSQPGAAMPADSAAHTSVTPSPFDAGLVIPCAVAPHRDTIDIYPVENTLGEGGMGQVLRVRDPDLNRRMALKIIKPKAATPEGLRRFMAEARLTARLHHPGIVAVHNTGALADGRVYYTMEEVRGQTLEEVIKKLHYPTNDPTDGLTLRRVVGWFHAACEAVAYAHSNGVIHRDLKPENIMIGAFGEVRVMDWGIARVTEEFPAADSDEPTLIDPEWSAKRTMEGNPIGTPMYMAPEQARGQLDLLGPHSDVYALGAGLFQVLTGRTPRTGRNAMGVMMQVIMNERRPLEGALPIPDALAEICDRAMEAAPEARFPNADQMAKALAAWLEGARKRADALALVARADQLKPVVAEARAQAHAARAEARRMLNGLARYAPLEDKRPAWALLDQAKQYRRSAERAAADVEQQLRAALSHVPELVEAHERLARLYQHHHAAAELARDEAETIRYEVLLKGHVNALPATHAKRQHWLAYLSGQGRLSLNTQPPGAQVQLFEYESIDRIRHAVPVAGPPRTPMKGLSVAKGSYLVELTAAHRATVRYPVRIERGAHWTGQPTQSDTLGTVWLPPAHSLGPEELYVAAGPAQLGGDTSAIDARPSQTVWLDGFCIQRDPVTNAAYLAFITDLVRRGKEQDAIRWAPKVDVSGEAGSTYTWSQDLPVVMISWHAAQAYAAWRSERDELPWRLPTENEWEKAARGVDGRFYPWGDHADPTLCRMRDSEPMPRPLVAVTAHPLDVSPYGVRGLGGNVRDWTADAFDEDGGIDAHRVVRGGAWSDSSDGCRSASRFPAAPHLPRDTVGIRLVRSIGPKRG